MAHPILRADINYNLLNGELGLSEMEKPYFNKYWTAFHGDFWQKGEDILLPPPSLKQGGGGIKAQEFLRPRYVSRNGILEVVERVSSAFLGKGPNWNYVVDGKKINLRQIKKQQSQLDRKQKALDTRRAIDPNDPLANQEPKEVPPPIPDPEAPPIDPTDQEKPKQLPPGIAPEDMPSPEDLAMAGDLEEIDKLLGEFWTTDGLGDKVAQAFESRLVSSRGGLRIYIPGKYKNKAAAKVNKSKTSTESSSPVINDPSQPNALPGKDAFIKFDTLADAVKAIKIEFVEPTKSKLLDEEGDLFSLVLYEKREDWNTNEMTKIIEFSFVDDAGNTFVGQFTDKDSDTVKGLPKTGPQIGITQKIGQMSNALNLDERPTFYEMSGRPYVSEQMFQQNQKMNLALTCGGFNLVDNGFGELLLTNAELEFEEIPDPDAENGLRKVPKGLKRGGGIINNFVGMEMTNSITGDESVTTPGVHFREPSQMTPFVDGYYLAYGALLEEAGQKFALISGDAAASGEARIQAMADFYLKIKKYKSEVDKLGSWLMTVILRFVAALVNEGDKFKDVSILFDSRIRVGNLTADERRIVMEMNKNGIISLETTRVLLDVEDPDLEDELVDKEKEKQMINEPPPPPQMGVGPDGKPMVLIPPKPGKPGNSGGTGNSI